MPAPRRIRGTAPGGLLAALLAVTTASACAGPGETEAEAVGAHAADESSTGTAEGFPEGTFDYQLGASYEPPAGVGTVVRDSTAEPAPDMYSICYVNGFQTQPGDLEWWLLEHPDLILRDASGEPVVDPGWPAERILDTSDEDKRADIAEILAETIATCAEKGFDAVEFDNLDSDLRSQGLLTQDHNLALATELVALANGHGMAAGQKNAAEVTERGRDEVGFEFAVAEDCAVWSECSAYTGVYGDDVIAVEYPDALEEAGMTFAEACDAEGAPSRMILRDLDLVGPEHGDYLYEAC
ncbi:MULTISPECIES: endo alpha-1,4 polygalactosaminidase [Nocardiopsidaceae]|uniref:Endo alpha-1,4 polygalactosaminidase n=1 Tax=Streptomonospora nanhaiensis TaxID=1323731 RepID=A0ABY6YUN5_9ACTN|nr:endo alpha-1,4 polygalactosaminidase [Streptomonospora nanhaiensis]WAE76000.1 endo alpha-1,4 polygalactosaminidase [Streptomonospora nanhaiensis]